MDIIKNKKFIFIISGVVVTIALITIVMLCIFKNDDSISVNMVNTVQEEMEENADIIDEKDKELLISLSLNKNSIVLNLDENKEEMLEAIIEPNDVNKSDIIWKSSDENIVKVNEDGKVFAVAEGTAIISATYEFFTSDCLVEVVKNETEENYLTNTEVDNTEVFVEEKNDIVTNKEENTKIQKKNKTPKQNVEISTSVVTKNEPTEEYFDINKSEINLNLTNKKSSKIDVSTNIESKVYFTSKDKNIANVDSNGNVTAVKIGTTKINVSCKNKSLSCVVNVSESGTAVDVEKENIVVAKENKSNDKIKDESKTVEAVSNNTKDSTDTNKSSNNNNLATKATLSNSNIRINKKQTKQLSFTIKEPEAAKSHKVTWKSSNANVATVNSNGLVTGVSKGTATISASVDNLVGKCNVTVSDGTEKITLSNTSIVLNAPLTKNFKLSATISPADSEEKVYWSSSNTNVATVDGNGKIIAKGIGTATITATSGKVSAKCTVTVKSMTRFGAYYYNSASKTFSTTKKSKNDLGFLMYIPDISLVKDLEEVPLVVNLHGAAERGTNLNALKRRWLGYHINKGKNYPAIIILPQCYITEGSFTTDPWGKLSGQLKGLIDCLDTKYSVNENKISICGHSMGAIGVWTMARNYPDLFSAVVPVSGYCSTTASRYTKAPVWVFAGSDGTSTWGKKLVNNINKNGGKAKFSYYNLSHDSMPDKVYIDLDVINWMIKRDRTTNSSFKF